MYKTCCKVSNVLSSNDIGAKVSDDAHWPFVVNAVWAYYTTRMYKQEYGIYATQ